MTSFMKGPYHIYSFFRPVYVGQSVKPIITPQMDAFLWTFVKKKDMDEKMFRALVSYPIFYKLQI